jgi:colanic acid biosynthesis glycosyl transferase WcaI
MVEATINIRASRVVQCAGETSSTEEDMKILIHGINYAPEIMGTGKYTGELGQWLAARGHGVRVVTAPPYYPAWRVEQGYSARQYRRERIAGVEVWRCPVWVPDKPSGLKRLLHLASFAACSSPVMLQQALWRPDVVVLIEPTLFCAPSAWLTARSCAARRWLHIQDLELDAATGLGMLDVAYVRRAMYWVESSLLRGAQRVSTITEAMQRRVAEKGVPEASTWLLPNWSDIEFVRPMHQDNEVRRQFGAGPDDVLVLYAGNMGEKQGLHLILDAADQLREQRHIKFAMVGAGATRDELERAAVRRGLANVRFYPAQPLERLPLTLAAGDVHLVVQRREAADLVMPSKLTNILAAGRPSVATADPGTALHTVLSDYDCGITTSPGSVRELVAAVVVLAEDAKMRERLGRNARRYAESHLDKEKILTRFETKMRELVRLGATKSKDRAKDKAA